MNKSVKNICYDEKLGVEAYEFDGHVQNFPNHFHDYYVIGIVENGRRILTCKNCEYNISPGDILLFNPEDNHSCMQNGDEILKYRSISISKELMEKLTYEITGKKYMVNFTENVICDEDIGYYLRNVHCMIMDKCIEFEKEEQFLFMISELIERYGCPFEKCLPEYRAEIEKACCFMDKNYMNKITLEDLCIASGLSKSTLLRAFTKTRGVTPYRYLETIRINKAKKLIEDGVAPIEAAMQTGFSDQSHFNRFFTSFIGISPGVYKKIFKEQE